jgi:hypothetical protein
VISFIFECPNISGFIPDGREELKYQCCFRMIRPMLNSSKGMAYEHLSISVDLRTLQDLAEDKIGAHLGDKCCLLLAAILMAPLLLGSSSLCNEVQDRLLQPDIHDCEFLSATVGLADPTLCYAFFPSPKHFPRVSTSLQPNIGEKLP